MWCTRIGERLLLNAYAVVTMFPLSLNVVAVVSITQLYNGVVGELSDAALPAKRKSEKSTE